MWSFLSSSSQVLLLLASTCSFLVRVCHEWRRIYWNRNQVFYRGLAFSILIFFATFWVNHVYFRFRAFFGVLLVLLSYCLSIQPFCYVSLIAIFLYKIVRFLSDLVGIFSCHLLPVVDKICFRCFGNFLLCLYCFTLCRYLFNLPSFAITFWFISSSWIVIFPSLPFPFTFQHIPSVFPFFVLSF